MLGDARSKRFATTLEIVAADPGIDAILVIVTPQAMTKPTSIAKAVRRVAETIKKPVLAAWLGGRSMSEGIDLLNEGGVATFPTPERAVQAFMTLMKYERNLEVLYETPREFPVEFEVDRAELRARYAPLLRECGGDLGEKLSKQLFADYGIPVARAQAAASADAAVEIAASIGYPVVLKIDSPDITHKSDVGGVALNLADEGVVRAAFARITEAAREQRPEARVLGVTVQPMLDPREGVELILGARKDPVFGSVLLAGLGGTAAELFGDHAIGFPPLTERLARRMLEGLKVWPLLNGFRGRPRLAVDKLLDALFRLSYLVMDFPEIGELDVNPLLVTERGVVALDARVIRDPELVEMPSDPFAHLAMRPYPEEYVKSVTLPGGLDVLLRPIKPEDEPLWLGLLRGCSAESLYQRFRHLFRWDQHRSATRYCFNDYDREIAIVAEAVVDGQRHMLGVGRLTADPDVETVEFAILVGDRWQGQGLGTVLTDYCLEISERWAPSRVFAQTTRENTRMLRIFKKRGFELRRAQDGSELRLVRELRTTAG